MAPMPVPTPELRFPVNKNRAVEHHGVVAAYGQRVCPRAGAL
jgi:hypothetical protein